MFSLLTPIFEVAAKSPLMSINKTGTLASAKLSASTFKVIVLPEPDAPVIRPCLLALFNNKCASCVSFFPINNLLFIHVLPPI